MPSDRQLAATFKEAMLQWDRQKADGVSREQRIQFLERILRHAWPFTREWKYLCANCDDTGAVVSQCPGDARCQSRWGERPHPKHEFITPCWCSVGNRFREKVQRTDEDLTAVAAKARKPSRLGR